MKHVLAVCGYAASVTCLCAGQFAGHELFAAFGAALVTVGYVVSCVCDRK